MITTAFSWGYYGWGNRTSELVAALDAVERSRGFKPPIFVDIRIRRSVRAKGFTGTAFEMLLGPSRHYWMKSLGNLHILSRTGPKIQIAEPESVKDLLALATEKQKAKQRLLFFCSCQWPRCDSKIHCHRATVAELLLNEARKQGVSLELSEWPGGERKHINLDVDPQVFKAVRNGRTTILVGNDGNLADIAGLPWCSVATLHSEGESIHRIVGPAKQSQGQWCLPVLWGFKDRTATDIAVYEKQADKMRIAWGLNKTVV